jgi:hypothetical protein
MNDVEDRLRDAYRAAGDTVRPETVRGLHMAGALPHRARGRRARWMGVVIPLGAAAAVAALVLGTSAIVPKATTGAGHGTTPRAAGGGRAQAAATGSLPEFTVAAEGSSLQVIRTVTGQVTGQVAAPAGQAFTDVAGTADDRTFLVAADLNPQTSCETFLYKVQLSGGGQPSAPAPLAVSGLKGTLPTTVALSADGRTAAFSTVRCAGETPGHIGVTQAIGGINLMDMATGHLRRQWSYSLGDDYPSDLSLSSGGGKLAFSVFLNGTQETVGRALSTGAASATVDSASEIVLRQPQGRYAGVDAVAISPDGGTLYACTHSGGTASRIFETLAAYSVTTGQRTRVLSTGQVTDLSCRLTMDPSGRYLLLAVPGLPTRVASPSASPTRKRTIPRNQVTTSVIAIDLTTGRLRTLPFQLPVAPGLAW